MAVELADAEYKSTLDSSSKKKAHEELNEIESDRASAVQAFRKWVLDQADWLKSPTDFEFLLRFLRVHKYSQMAARQCLENFLANITDLPEWLSNLDPADTKLQEILRLGIYFSPKKRDKQGRRVLITRFGAMGSERLKVEIKSGFYNFFRALALVALWLVCDENSQVNGIVTLMDMSDMSLEHMSAIFSKDHCRKYSRLHQDALPKRVKRVHVYKEPPVFDAMFAVAAVFMKNKIRDRVCGKNMTTVYEEIDMSALPTEYLPDDYKGPSAGPINQIIEEMIEDMVNSDYRNYIMDLTSSKYGVLHSKKPAADGLVETYRKMTVD